MINAFKKLFGGNQLKSYENSLAEINALEPEIKKLNDEELKSESLKLRERITSGESLGDISVRAFALSREAAWRALGQRPYDVQIIGGLVLHRGAVAEMMTGEGKTLAAVQPAYLNALSGNGVHVVTVNEYLARRDAVWMGRVYRALGLSVACLVPSGAFLYDPEWKIPEGDEALIAKEEQATGSFMVQQDYLRPISRREAYLADVTYGTNTEFGFDYLRDNLAYNLMGQVQRGHNFAIIDEVDSILIDEARTPLIISAPDAQSSEFYKTFARVAAALQKDADYEVDEKHKAVHIIESGIEKVEKMVGVQNLYAPENLRLVHYMEESLKAQALFQRDRDYVVKNGEIIIVDEFTGRMLHGRRYNGGLHQAIEAKEGVLVKEESRTYGQVTIQNYFRMYDKISGMTGTAQTSAEEFHKVYNLEVASIPPNKPLARKDANDVIYKSLHAKYEAIIKDVRERYEKGQPVLIGTTSIEKNELLSAMLGKAGVPHEILNAKNNEREGAIIAQAGRLKAVTVATNMAGRGVDIILGGNPPESAEAEKVRALGGLHVIGTERHDARRIDNQLRGRAGRQGDPGSSQFYLSVEDDLLRIFGGDRIKSVMERFDLPEDQPLQFGFLSRTVAQAQEKVEGANFDIRKRQLEFDDVLNKQRKAVYRRRQEIFDSLNKAELGDIIFHAVEDHVTNLWAGFEAGALTKENLKQAFAEAGLPTEGGFPEEPSLEVLKELVTKRSLEASVLPQAPGVLLSIIDMLWMAHLENMEATQEAVNLRGYAQHDPLVEYRQESHRMFKDFWTNFNALIFANIFKLAAAVQGASHAAAPVAATPAAPVSAPVDSEGRKVGRNDPCPCGSGKKYKHCHGK